MTKLASSTTIICAFFGVLFLSGTPRAQTRPPIIEQLAKTYGLDSFAQIEVIRYTRNGQLNGLNISRSWVWEPKTNRVSYEGKDKDGKPVKLTYIRSELSSQPDIVKNEVDPAFNADNYGLLMPFHIYWDTSATVTDRGMHKLPVGSGSAELVEVKYPNEGGYTPGDTYEVYISEGNRIELFAYRRGGPKASFAISRWTGYKKAGPLLIPTEIRGTAGGKPFHLVFSDVAVKLTGSDNWLKAE
jgi:hypothetical protein